MTKDKLWQTYVARNPQFKDEANQVSLTVRGLKKLFSQSYDIGFLEASYKNKNKTDFMDLFSNLTGKR